ncbi:hypothetical protein D910_03298 [Dendroctonus ponderosae]|uniref:Enoyl reductase (ER) domain-containing protein n=2 Tax=Dendroctonus ponderosae TaxID=77166 RepID=U4U0T6_DENPD|nr:hypothetical protein D910_03298 [Dendroctonus ponderosae]
MGLATLDKDTCTLVPDPILNWPIPQNWSLEDAATVPYAFSAVRRMAEKQCLAFHALCIKGELKSGNTVLIHAACSPIGMAAIAIAHQYACTIYATVSTDQQREYIKKKFRTLSDRQLFSSDNQTFEPHLLMATGGRGADIILNCVSGSLLQASLACIADFGKFLQIGKYDLEENNSIGMFPFLRNVSFYAVDLNIAAQEDEVKENIKKLIEGAIENRVVTPIWRIVYNNQDVGTILKYVAGNFLVFC